MDKQTPAHTSSSARWAMRLVIAVAVSGGAAVAPTVARAAPADNEAKANQLYQDAKAKFEAKDYERAEELIEQAEKLFPHPMIVLQKGRILRMLGRLRDAETALKQCKAGSAQLPNKALHILTDELIGLSDEMRAKGELLVTVESSGDVQVQLDGSDIKVPYARWLPPGRHKVDAASSGHKPVHRDVDVVAAATAEVKLNLDKRDGRLVVVVPGSLRNVEVRIDGRVFDIEDAARIGDRAPPKTVDPGPHEVVCIRGERQVGSKVDVPADGQVDARCDGLEPPESGSKKIVGWSGVAVGGGLLAFGAYNVGYYAYKKSDGFVERVPDGSVSRLSGGVGYALFGAAVGVGSWLVWLRSGGGDSASAQAAPPQPAAVAWAPGAVAAEGR